MRCKSLFTFGAGFVDEGTSYQCELNKGHKGMHRHEPTRKSKYSRGYNGVITWNTEDATANVGAENAGSLGLRFDTTSGLNLK